MTVALGDALVENILNCDVIYTVGRKANSFVATSIQGTAPPYSLTVNTKSGSSKLDDLYIRSSGKFELIIDEIVYPEVEGVGIYEFIAKVLVFRKLQLTSNSAFYLTATQKL